MAWGLFVRPAEHQTMPRFKIPLSRSLLNDPAFSPDPRAHPHFPLAHANSYKALPPTPALAHRSSPPPACDALVPCTTSPSTVPSTISPSKSSTHTRGSHVAAPHPSTQHKVTPDPPQHPFLLPVPHLLPRVDTLARENLNPVPSQNRRIPRKGAMKALVRRLTTRHNLDRIDELDETDPFGGSYHHDGPYEAIASDCAQSTLPSSADIRHVKRQSDPLPLRPGQHKSASRVPSNPGETGLSLYLEPGQILQQNTVYSSYASRTAAVPSQFRREPNKVAIVTRPDHSGQSLPNPRMRSPEDSPSLDLLHGLQNQPLLFPNALQERYSGDKASDTLDSLALRRDHDPAPNPPIFPPPRYESRLYNSLDPQPRSMNPTSKEKQSTGSTVHALPLHGFRHESIRSLDISYALSNTITQSSSSIHHQPLEPPPRIRHLPKRLVMPTPLQHKQPQPHHKCPPAGTTAWQDEHHPLEGVQFEGQHTICIQKPRLLRKKSSAFPAKTPTPVHIPSSPDDTTLIRRNSPTTTTDEAQGMREGTRRRRLSKRKDDI